MKVLEKFTSITALICEPARARMLWKLLDGRACTATELAVFADISANSASNHLSRLLDADIVKVTTQGRHRYYSFSNAEVAYAVEAMAQLVKIDTVTKLPEDNIPEGIRYCRTCYDHLAGFVSVKIIEAMEQKGFLKKSGKIYRVTEKGWKWFSQFKIYPKAFEGNRRPLTRQCLDWSERRPHLAGQLGAELLHAMLIRKWFKKIPFSRELVVTSKGRQEIYQQLGLSLR